MLHGYLPVVWPWIELWRLWLEVDNMLSMHRTIVTFIDEVDRGGEEGGQDRPWKRTSGNLKNVRCNELPPS